MPRNQANQNRWCNSAVFHCILEKNPRLLFSSRRRFRFYSNLDYILFMGCKVKSAGFSNWIRYLTGFLRRRVTALQKQLGDIPCSLHHAASVRPLCLHSVTSPIHSSRERPGARFLLIMKPQNVVNFYLLSSGV